MNGAMNLPDAEGAVEIAQETLHKSLFMFIKGFHGPLMR